jgi:Ca2+-binding RTX toxin-like protein
MPGLDEATSKNVTRDRRFVRSVARTRLEREKGNKVQKIGFLTLTSLVLALLALTTGPSRASAQEVFTCDGKTPTIVATAPGTFNGTSGDDIIIGTAGDDIINGGAGNDTICGEGGNDRLNGGSGDDRMWGEVARGDVLIGVAGSDDLKGGSGGDLLVDSVGAGQALDGGSGNDTVLGFGTLNGGSGADSLRVGGTPTDPSTLNGGSGGDRCEPFSEADILKSCETVV